MRILQKNEYGVTGIKTKTILEYLNDGQIIRVFKGTTYKNNYSNALKITYNFEVKINENLYKFEINKQIFETLIKKGVDAE